MEMRSCNDGKRMIDLNIEGMSDFFYKAVTAVWNFMSLLKGMRIYFVVQFTR